MVDPVVNWEYYRSLYFLVDESSFNRLEPQAEKQVQLVIGKFRWNSINPNAFYYEQLKDCICRTVEKLAEYEKSGIGRGLASVSNDGYTENYTVQTSTQISSELRASIVGWLSGTGLVGAFTC